MQKFNMWDLPIDEVFLNLKSRKEGLSDLEAQERLNLYGPNSLKPPKRFKFLLLFLNQFKSPLLLLLIAAAILSYFMQEKADTDIILTIIFFSCALNFFQEKGAINSMEKLLQLVENKTRVVRGNVEREILNRDIVLGDIVHLRAGDVIPADCILLESNNLFVNEAVLTGESLPIEKSSNGSSKDALKSVNALFLGTTIASGFATALVVATGRNTEYGRISEEIRFRPPLTSFEVGVKQFGYFLIQITLVMVMIIFAINVYFHKPVLESFLFSLAIAVGITPQLLPVIISVNLARGARRMAEKKVIVKRLASIQNLGQMNILCTDKTGTITLGQMSLVDQVDAAGNNKEKVCFYGFLNAQFQTGYANPLDQAILAKSKFDVAQWKKLDEIPYDFIRKRLSILFENQGRKILVTKGALLQTISVCNRVELPDGTIAPLQNFENQILNYFEERGSQGYKILGLAYGEGEEEKDLVFLGFLCFSDPIKPGVQEVLAQLKEKGVSHKIISGDHQAVTANVARALGIDECSIITGPELRDTSDEALLKIVNEKNIFAQIEPNQKEDIILALRQSGNVVGYLGDGVNDISAIRNADVGISVDNGVDAAKEAADIILLEKDLAVLERGIDEGRHTFVNTLKYIYMASSANFSNTLSMTGASFFLSFLPALPKQVLLTNFFSDLPDLALATDRVDSDLTTGPVIWNVPIIRRFMIIFGALASLTDYVTFGFLLFWMKADPAQFRTGWFLENVITASVAVLLIRTRHPFFRSRPSILLIFAVFAVIFGVPLLILTPFGRWFDFVPLPSTFYLALIGIIAFYILSVEITKHFFYHYYRKMLSKKT